MAAEVRSDAGHGLVLVRRSPAAVTRWLRRGLVAVTVAPFGPWTGITLADDRARSAAPYDVGLEVLAARPAPWRARPTIGFFDVHGRAALTVQPTGPRAPIPGWCGSRAAGVVATRRMLTRLHLPMLLAAAGATGPGARGGARRRAALRPRRARSTCSSPCSGCSACPGATCSCAATPRARATSSRRVRGILAFDRLMAEEAAHRAETADDSGGRR